MARRDSDPFLQGETAPGVPEPGPPPAAGDPSPLARRLRALGGRLVLGCGLIVAGVLATLDNLDLLDAGDYFLLWPLLVIAFGLTQLPASRTPAERIGAAAWMLVGVAFLASNLGWVRFDIWDLSPILVAVVGLLLVARALRPRRTVEGRRADDGSEVHGFAFLSGLQRGTADRAFTGGSLTAVMGGCRADLRGARLEGGRANLDVLAFWGGIEIVVPPRWRVENRVVPFMGGADDHSSPPAADEAEGTLEVTGWAVMGGVEIKNQA